MNNKIFSIEFRHCCHNRLQCHLIVVNVYTIDIVYMCTHVPPYWCNGAAARPEIGQAAGYGLSAYRCPADAPVVTVPYSQSIGDSVHCWR